MSTQGTEAYWVRYTQRILREMEAQVQRQKWRALKFKHRIDDRKRRHYVMQGGDK